MTHCTETLRSYDPEAIKFLENLGHNVGLINGEKHSKSFLFQSIGISIQKGMDIRDKRSLWQIGRTLISFFLFIIIYPNSE